MHVDPVIRTRRRLRLAWSWLATGSAVLALTPVPAYTHALGWSPLVWLVLAPAALLTVLDPRLPARLTNDVQRRLRARPRHAAPLRQAVWRDERARR